MKLGLTLFCRRCDVDDELHSQVKDLQEEVSRQHRIHEGEQERGRIFAEIPQIQESQPPTSVEMQVGPVLCQSISQKFVESAKGWKLVTQGEPLL